MSALDPEFILSASACLKVKMWTKRVGDLSPCALAWQAERLLVIGERRCFVPERRSKGEPVGQPAGNAQADDPTDQENTLRHFVPYWDLLELAGQVLRLGNRQVTHKPFADIRGWLTGQHGALFQQGG